MQESLSDIPIEVITCPTASFRSVTVSQGPPYLLTFQLFPSLTYLVNLSQIKPFACFIFFPLSPGDQNNSVFDTKSLPGFIFGYTVPSPCCNPQSFWPSSVTLVAATLQLFQERLPRLRPRMQDAGLTCFVGSALHHFPPILSLDGEFPDAVLISTFG